jgi:hypothetical protein
MINFASLPSSSLNRSLARLLCFRIKTTFLLAFVVVSLSFETIKDKEREKFHLPQERACFLSYIISWIFDRWTTLSEQAEARKNYARRLKTFFFAVVFGFVFSSFLFYCAWKYNPNKERWKFAEFFKDISNNHPRPLPHTHSFIHEFLVCSRWVLKSNCLGLPTFDGIFSLSKIEKSYPLFIQLFVFIFSSGT